MCLRVAVLIVLVCYSLADRTRGRDSLLKSYFPQHFHVVRRSLLNHVYGRSAVRQGMEAMRLLKQGAVGVPTNGFMNQREFLKHGGIRQAVADFKALQPDDIRVVMHPGQVSARAGSVGDRTVYISTAEGTGKASVTVVKSWNGFDTQVDKFIYLD